MRTVRRLPLLILASGLVLTAAQRFGGRGRYPTPPPPAPSEDYYKLLGVSRGANDRAIKKAYRKLALKHHPDKVKDEKKKEIAKERFIKIANAYDTLVDPEKRRIYDQLGEEGLKNGGRPGGGGPGGSGFGGFRQGGGGGAQFDSDEAYKMFESMFGRRDFGGSGGGGGGRGGFGSAGGAGQARQPRARADLESVPLDLGLEGGLGITLSRSNRVTAIKPGGPAAKAGRLRIGDQIHALDGQPVEGQRVSQLLANSQKRRVVLGVAFEEAESVAHRVSVRRGPDGLGFKISADNEIVSIAPGGTAAREGKLRVGDRVLQVDGQSARGKKVGGLLQPGKGEFEFLLQPKLRVSHQQPGAQPRARQRAGFGAGGGFGEGMHMGGGGGGMPGGINMEDMLRGMGGMGGSRMPNMGGFGGL